MAVEVRVVTDPACAWSWASEPKLRRLEWEFGDRLDWRSGARGRLRGRSGHLDLAPPVVSRCVDEQRLSGPTIEREPEVAHREHEATTRSVLHRRHPHAHPKTKTRQECGQVDAGAASGAEGRSACRHQHSGRTDGPR